MRQRKRRNPQAYVENSDVGFNLVSEINSVAIYINKSKMNETKNK